MKILYIVNQFFPLFHTGSERLTLDTAKQIQRMGHFVTVLTYEPNPPLETLDKKSQHKEKESVKGFEKLDKYLMKKEYQYQTIPVIAFKYTKHTLGFRIFDPNLEKYLYDIVKKFDLIHFTHPMFFCSALKACKKLGIPTVLTLSDTWLLSPRSLVTSNFQLCDGPEEGRKCMRDCYYGEEVLRRYKEAKFFFDNVDCVFASSEFGRRIFLENDWKRNMEVIHYSRDYSNVKILGEPKQLVFGFMSSLIWNKGADVLVKAFKKVENDKIKLKIFGRGDERDPYLKDLRRLSKDDKRIEFSGTFDHTNLPEVMRQFSVVVVPSSYRDNYPLVVQESLAYQKPVIGSKNGGIPESIEEGVNGYLFEPGNVDELAKIIFTISKNPEIIQKLKKGIRPPPRIESEALRYENVYRELVHHVSGRITTQKLPLRDLQVQSLKEIRKLLFVTHNLNLEGAPKWVYFLARELKKKGYDVTVCSPQEGPLGELFRKENIEMIIDPKFQSEEGVDARFFEQFDLVFLNTIVNSIFVEKIKSVKVPVVLAIHESERDVYMSQGYKESPIKNADKVVFASEATRKVYSDLETAQNFRTIHTAIDFDEIASFKAQNIREDLRKKHGLSENDMAITILGTTIERKGQLVFAEAAIKLLDSGHSNLHFFIVGAIEIDYLDKIRDKINKSNHSEKIHIIPVTGPYDYYYISDMFIGCSFIESFPNTTMEAMAFEIPIIATDVYGVTEQIQDGKDGILIKPGDSDLLVQKIEFLLDNSKLAKQYAQNAYSKIKSELTMEKAISIYDKLIKEIIE